MTDTTLASGTSADSPSTDPLLREFTLGDLRLPNRMVMAPMTRNRAGEGLAPTEMNARYYGQRASAGLIITEATQVTRRGLGYPNTPGIHTDAQVSGWRRVTNAVHLKGGRIFAQLWHVGRISHPDLQENGELPVAPSAVKPEGEAMTEEGKKPFVEPHALTVEEIRDVVQQYKHGAVCAKSAEFDGVEVHAANGYLIDQFLQDRSNQRTDDYGGPIENRMRFAIEVLEAVLEVWPAHRVGIRISPCSDFNDMGDSDPGALFRAFVEKLDSYGLAYLHLIEGNAHEGAEEDLEVPTADVRSWFSGPLMLNSGYTKERGNEAISKRDAELISFGRPYIANPDLVQRFAQDAELNEPDHDTFYGGGEEGYTDYPTLHDTRGENR
ncbi:N-ethylmaleimide reductase [Planctomycetes bacterium Poly30]|uniref:N-ethylmaleimide reductase n=1 Tax=Saltatorellus ferox TaxID=2528018 RepID=A0A518EUY5_9BACT|nr:N-ethylmaleimide reductase [Planctomycetes bacterium Poly30]